MLSSSSLGGKNTAPIERLEDGVKPVAVVDIGSTAIRLVVLEVSSDGTYRRLEIGRAHV